MFRAAISRSFAAKYQTPFLQWRIIKGDTVAINTGKDKGKVGEVLKVYRKTNRVLITGINVKLKKIKSDMDGEIKGGIKPVIRPIHVSNVNLIDPVSGKPTRIRMAYNDEGKKVRISKKTQSVIPKPVGDMQTYESRHKGKVDGPLDTSAAKVLKITYKGEDFDRVKREFEEYISKKDRIESLLIFDK